MADGTLDLIDLVQNRTGYREFLSCYAYRDDELTFLVDPGPASTIPHLLRTLDDLEIEHVDLILLTHIHLDHGGGAAQVIDKYPEAKLYCHEVGERHILDPEKLWKGSIQVLGEVARLYGEPSPVPAENMVGDEEVESRGIRIIPTPGHASHHVSFLRGDILFAGEAIGTRIDLESGLPYLRPATPPKFVLDVALESLDRILALEHEPKWVAFAHYGLTDGAFSWCRRAKKQLIVWVETLRSLLEESEDDLEDRFFRRLMEIDPLYGRGRFDELPADLQERERSFLTNTMNGMLGYIRNS